MRSALPIVPSEHPRGPPKPSWLKIRPPGGEHYRNLKAQARRLKLATVCEEAQCPNLAECWGGGTATFMLMGDTCTRGCRFCAVQTARHPPLLDPNEPEHIAEAVASMDLRYVVLTSVNRDDLNDGGAAHLASCLHAIHRRSPEVLLEMLIPDFEGNKEALKTITGSPISVLAHNVETVERLSPTVRDPRASYHQSLEVLKNAKSYAPEKLTKSSLMLGLGETEEEIIQAMKDLRSVGVDVLTLGQYLRPSKKHLPVVRYLPPQIFDELQKRAQEMGFGYVAAGPLVRSSYRAFELYMERQLRPKNL